MSELSRILNAIEQGDPHASRQLNDRANTPGFFDYSFGPGIVLNAGTYTLATTFTPAESIRDDPCRSGRGSPQGTV